LTGWQVIAFIDAAKTSKFSDASAALLNTGIIAFALFLIARRKKKPNFAHTAVSAVLKEDKVLT
jgi:hypothetical protein